MQKIIRISKAEGPTVEHDTRLLRSLGMTLEAIFVKILRQQSFPYAESYFIVSTEVCKDHF